MKLESIIKSEIKNFQNALKKAQAHKLQSLEAKAQIRNTQIKPSKSNFDWYDFEKNINEKANILLSALALTAKANNSLQQFENLSNYIESNISEMSSQQIDKVINFLKKIITGIQTTYKRKTANPASAILDNNDVNRVRYMISVQVQKYINKIVTEHTNKILENPTGRNIIDKFTNISDFEQLKPATTFDKPTFVKK